jgi:hypothetical protein
MSDFRQRLWSELVAEHSAALAYPAPARDRLRDLPIVEPRAASVPRWPWPASVRGRLAASLTALAAALAAAALAVTTGTAPSAAYAVTRSSDGTVHVSIDDLTGISGANAQLEQLGVPVRVAPVLAGCQAGGEIVTPLPPSLAGTVAHAEAGIAVRPELVPAGDTLVLTARQVGSAVYLTYALYRGAAPSCVAAR